ncbi:5'-nucleotidase domain-containing protein [Paenibacillus algicola]|uniref:5'-nucleotidase domain-containing protein n=1 Tax=Paenibacillus algicola TaxID=2565926 RepID=A0A4P8XGU1_9BACL|nr:bifunctional UDP-sugar hydrolase/5'-nucleotidase [Paenibacillus algicola]QCT01702.1 5'-nucleotidase domain-containing protein [Paenibacillus algicola]
MEDHRCEVILLQTSDVHGCLLPRSYADQSEVCYGLARVASIIKEERRKHKQVLLMDSGDSLQGTPLTYYHARVNSTPAHPVIACMNELGYDAAGIGNHEFNYGLPYLERTMKEARFPWLSANILDTATGQPKFGPPYLIKELPLGLRIGILGLTTSYIPNWERPEHIAGLTFSDPVEAARTWVHHMKKHERADVIVVAYHGGLERDVKTGVPTEPLTGENVGIALCQQVPGIDVLLTGHQHRSLAGYEVNGVCVVQPGYEGRALGKVTLQLANEGDGWKLLHKQSELMGADDYEPDPVIEDKVREVEALTQAWLDQPIGEVDGDLSIHAPAEVRLSEHPLIEWINRVQMDVSGADVSCTALFDNRSSGFGAVITMRDLVTFYVYPNTLKVLRISGRDLREALEQSAQYFTLDDTGAIIVHPAYLAPKPQHYNYDMWEGIEYTLDISRPAGQRVTRLEHNGRPVVDQQAFDVVMNNYRASGGGNFEMFRDKPVVKDIPMDMVELLADYITSHGRITASVNHNWLVVGGHSPAPDLARGSAETRTRAGR